MTKFICKECGVRVHAFDLDTPPDPPRCADCAWAWEFIPDPAERKRQIAARRATVWK